VVLVPRDAAVDVVSENGPVSAVDVNGDVKIQSENGPVSILRARGKVVVEATNGPIAVTDSSGEVRLEAQNGPLAGKLGEDRWNGAGLDARTENGPLSLRVPERYGSGVEVTMSSHSPYRCSGACEGARKSWDDDREGWGRQTHRVELGAGAAVVKLSTVNGPVSIKSQS
jgi:DUF4097 and DUF4098 domain-containing protein YvlB